MAMDSRVCGVYLLVKSVVHRSCRPPPYGVTHGGNCKQHHQSQATCERQLFSPKYLILPYKIHDILTQNDFLTYQR